MITSAKSYCPESTRVNLFSSGRQSSTWSSVHLKAFKWRNAMNFPYLYSSRWGMKESDEDGQRVSLASTSHWRLVKLQESFMRVAICILSKVWRVKCSDFLWKQKFDLLIFFLQKTFRSMSPTSSLATSAQPLFI